MNRPAREKQKAIVERQVADMLRKSRSFHALPQNERQKIATNTAAIVEAMVQNGGPARPAADPYAMPLADDPQSPLTPLTPPQPAQPVQSVSPTIAPPDQRSVDQKDFGLALRTGVQQAGQLLREVNFPDFVASLIRGVFNAIVDASIKQMKAYGELVQSVAMSLDDFKDQNTTDNQAKDHLVQKYPSVFQLNIGDQGPKIATRAGAEDDGMAAIQRDFGGDITDLDDDTIEQKIIPLARLNLAKQRQQLLATMVLMGINRIIVTDGKINAKLKFNFTATDNMVGQDTATKYDNLGTSTVTTTGQFDMTNMVKGQDTSVTTPIIQVADVSDTSTSANLTAAAQMTGEVTVNFKSETFPLEKMVNSDQMLHLNNAQAGAGRAAPPAGAAATPATAAPAAQPAAPAVAPTPAAAPAPAPAPA